MFRSQRAAVMTIIDRQETQKSVTDIVPAVLPNLQQWTQTLLMAVKPVLLGYAFESARRLWAKLGGGPPGDGNNVGSNRFDSGDDNRPGLTTSFDLVPPKLDDSIERLALAFCEETNATTSRHLTEALSKLREDIRAGLFQGETLPEMRRRVNDVFDHAERWRAHRIAQTESSRAVHSAELIAARESGIVKAKRWLASGDACLACIELANAGPVALDTPYKVHSTGRAEYREVMHPPLHPHCACSETLVVDEEMLQPGIAFLAA